MRFSINDGIIRRWCCYIFFRVPFVSRWQSIFFLIEAAELKSLVLKVQLQLRKCVGIEYQFGIELLRPKNLGCLRELCSSSIFSSEKLENENTTGTRLRRSSLREELSSSIQNRLPLFSRVRLRSLARAGAQEREAARAKKYDDTPCLTRFGKNKCKRFTLVV